MRKIIIVLFCLISLVTKAQVYQEMPQYGYRANRMSFDSTLQIPTTCGVPALKSVVNVSKKAAIAFDSCNNKFYKYNPKTLTWSEVSGGGTTPNLQQVTDVIPNGNITTNYIQVGDDIRIKDSYSNRIARIGAQNSLHNVNRTILFPDEDGFITLSVNNTKADSTGNISISQIDTTSLSNRINTKIDSLKRQTDSVFARKNGSWIFQYNGFVPYTGATGDVDLGNFQLNAKAIKINGTAGSGHIDLKHQSADASATGSSTALFANSNGDLKWKNDNKYYTTLTTNQTADRVYTFQNKSYTLADSADVAAKVNYSDTSSSIATKTNLTTKLNTSDSTIYYSKYRSDTSRSNIYSAINGKQATISLTTTGTTGAATFTSNTLNIPNYSNNDALVAQAYGLLGSTIKGINLCLPNYAMMTGTTAALASGTVRFIAYYLPNAQTITGVKWWSSANASYTANNYNGVGLYSYSGGTLTLIASSTNDGTIWSGAASNSMGSKAFSQQIALSAGIYYIGLLYSSSAQTTAPSLGSAGVMTQTNMGSADFTNSARLLGSLISQTALPNSQALSGTSSGTATLGVWLY